MFEHTCRNEIEPPSTDDQEGSGEGVLGHYLVDGQFFFNLEKWVPQFELVLRENLVAADERTFTMRWIGLDMG